MQIGKHLQLQEWSVDWEDEDVNHRHVSHLVGVYPGKQLTESSSPEFFQAARKSLEIRGDGGTGWSLAWKICLWARFKEGGRAVWRKNKLRKAVIHFLHGERCQLIPQQKITVKSQNKNITIKELETSIYGFNTEPGEVYERTAY